MNTTPTSKSLHALVAILGVMAGLSATSPVFADTTTDAKIRLMAEGLAARDAGDLQTAKHDFEELARLAPGDARVQSLLNGVNQDIATQASAPAAPAPEAAPATAPSDEAPAAAEAPVAAAPSDAGSIAQAEADRINELIAAAQISLKDANASAKKGEIDAANDTLDAAISSLPVNTVTGPTLAQLSQAKTALLLDQAQQQLARGDVDGARQSLESYAAQTPLTGHTRSIDRKAQKVTNQVAEAEANPPQPPISEASPGYRAERIELGALMAKGRAQFNAGDLEGAQATYLKVETQDPYNSEAKAMLFHIANAKGRSGSLNRVKTAAQMMQEVSAAWDRPQVFVEGQTVTTSNKENPLEKKLDGIKIPSVSFNAVELSKVINTLNELSVEFDSATDGSKGVNFVVLDPTKANPTVTITLRDFSLRRILDFVTQNIGYQYEIQQDAVIVKPGGGPNLQTVFFPVTRATVIRMTGIGGTAPTPAATGGGAGGGGGDVDPFAEQPAGGGAAAAASQVVPGEAGALRNFLQSAGIPFDNVPGASLAYDGAAIIVTQTDRNLEKIRGLLNRYSEIRQVEIEAKFMEVQEGALDELGVDWDVSGDGVAQFDSNGVPLIGSDGKQLTTARQSYTTAGVNRTLANAFTGSTSGGVLQIVTENGLNLTESISPPSIPGSVSLGSGASALASITGAVGSFDINATIRALAQKQGSELLSAPKVTVLSGNPATITIGQELRYPRSYSEPDSNVGSTGGSNSGGSAGVTVTPGTPQDFDTRTVGVELRVTPTVEDDDYSITLDLNPRVTEFEGFVEYGAPSVAISGGNVVRTPSGFYQPIFNLREVSTKVTIWDGATLVLGGLTREEVKRVDDKVPILGDIPVLGRAFRSKGESSLKRNLLIFVTANLVSPGGSPKHQTLRGVQPNSTFQNPTLVTPSSSETRSLHGSN